MSPAARTAPPHCPVTMAVAFEGNIVFDAAHKFQNHKKKLRSVVLSVNICDQKTFLKHDFDAGGNL